MSRYFTLAQAQVLLPEVESLLRRALAAREQLTAADRELKELHHRVAMAGGASLDPSRTLALRARRDEAVAGLKGAIESIQELGVQVKDLDIGLIDFPTLYRGREVLLCWRLGEPRIAHWHGLEDGFRGRKPVDRDFLENHAGDTPQ